MEERKKKFIDLVMSHYDALTKELKELCGSNEDYALCLYAGNIYQRTDTGERTQEGKMVSGGTLYGGDTAKKMLCSVMLNDDAMMSYLQPAMLNELKNYQNTHENENGNNND